MSEHHYSTILEKLEDLKKDINHRIDSLEHQIKSEMSLKHQEIDFKLAITDGKASKHEKVLNWLAGVVATVLISALLYSILK